jgi:hypothetical protein
MTTDAPTGTDPGTEPTSNGRSRSLDDLALGRSGIVTRHDLRTAGWPSSAVDRALRTGRLHRIAAGVYRVDGAPFTRTAARHASLAIVTRALLAHRSAAELHGFVEQRAGPISLLLPHHYRTPRPVGELFTISRTRTLRDEEWCEVDGLAATTPARTLLDLAALTSSSRLAEIAAAAFRTRACCAEDILEVLDLHRRARGRQRLVEALDILGSDAGRSRSDVEVAALPLLVDAGLPRPVVGHKVRDPRGRSIAELDLAYPEHLIAIEIDGFQWHSSPARKRADEDRQNRLVVAGWTVLRFSAADVRRRPDHLVATVRAALETAFARG